MMGMTIRARLRRAITHAFFLTALTTLAACQGGGADLSQAYALYDSRVERELVAGRDEVRGNYVEVRFSPKGRDGKAVLKPEGGR